MLSENMSEEALVADWIVYDVFVNTGGLENVKVDKEMMKYVGKSHSHYLHHLKTSKENQNTAKKKKVEKSKLSYDIKKAKEGKQNDALSNCREKLLNMIPRFSIWKNNLESNNFLAIFSY